jgi:hypothetical protein
MWFFKKSPEQIAQETKEEDERQKNEALTRILDLYEELCSVYSAFVAYYLKQCDTEEKLRSTWDFFAEGLYQEDILGLADATDNPGAWTVILDSARNGKYVAKMSDGAPVQGTPARDLYFLNMKPLVNIFMNLLADSDGLNVLCDYLEESGYVNEDGAAIYDFCKDGDKRIIKSYSFLYEKVEYDPETGMVKS